MWKAQYGEVALGLNSDLYLQPVFDKRCSRQPLRHARTLQNDITFVNETFSALVEDLSQLAKKHGIESFLPPNLRVDLNKVEEALLFAKNSDSFSDNEEIHETTL